MSIYLIGKNKESTICVIENLFINFKAYLFFFRSEDEEGDENRFYYNGGEANRSTGPPLYPHNTYHGPGLGYNHHQRTPLAQANFRPLKFTDKYSPRTSSSMNNGDQDAIQDEVSVT